MPSSIFRRLGLNSKNGLFPLQLRFPVLMECKIVDEGNIFPVFRLYPTEPTSQAYRFTLSLFSCQMFGWAPFRPFSARRHHSTSIESNHPHFHGIPDVRIRFHQAAYSQELILCRTDSCTLKPKKKLNLFKSSVNNSYNSPYNVHFLLHLLVFT